MYVLTKSLLDPIGEYRVEIYDMAVLSYDIEVDIKLKVFGEGEDEFYVAEYIITRADEKTTSGAIVNRPTKEATIEAIEEAVIQTLEDKNHHWS